MEIVTEEENNLITDKDTFTWHKKKVLKKIQEKKYLGGRGIATIFLDGIKENKRSS